MEFTSLVNVITSAFGDATRRDIYVLTHENPGGVTVGEAARATGLHANVARHHLDKLANGGYLEVSQRPSTGAGRPAKVYRATETDLHLEFSVGHDDILVALLGKALSRLGEAESMRLAEEVGEQLGRRMADSATSATTAAGDPVDEALPAQRRSFRSALHVVADALSAHGFAAHTEREGDDLRIVSTHCPFGDVAIEHPVICAVDRGMVRGLLASLYGETEVVLESSLARGDDSCVADVHLIPD